jgi:TonB family protein
MARIEGTVLVAFVVNADGNVDGSSAMVLRGVHPDLDREARRVITASIFWPGCRGGIPVRVRVTAPITFFFK